MCGQYSRMDAYYEAMKGVALKLKLNSDFEIKRSRRGCGAGNSQANSRVFSQVIYHRLYDIGASFYFQHQLQQAIAGLARACADRLIVFVVQHIDSAIGIERKDHRFCAHQETAFQTRPREAGSLLQTRCEARTRRSFRFL